MLTEWQWKNSNSSQHRGTARLFRCFLSKQELSKLKEPIRVLRWANSPNRNYTARRVALLSAKELGLSTELCPWLLLSRSMFVAARYFGCCDIIQGTHVRYQVGIAAVPNAYAGSALPVP